MDKDVSALLASYPELKCISTDRIRCSLTGHEMPINYETILHFVQDGSKFQRMKNLQDQLRQHEAYFEDRGSYLFCTLTRRSVVKNGEEIERHINGRKFQNALRHAMNHSADENGNAMDATPFGFEAGFSTEPPFSNIDDSDDASLLNDFPVPPYKDEDSSSSSGLQDMEALNNKELYPELDFDNTGGDGDSDIDFNMMNTDLDADTSSSSKRKVDNHASDMPAKKRQRN